MTEKLYEYVGFIGRLHYIRDSIRESWHLWKEKHPDGLRGCLKSSLLNFSEHKPQDDEYDKTEYAHLHRRKTRQELIRVSAAVMGIEFSYAAETAFVSPTLLKIGVDHQYMTFVWALSPLVGFFLTPILGSISDRCQLKIGRRRPFIILMSIGVILGLLLVPNGEDLGYMAGDIPPAQNATIRTVISYRTSALSYERNVTLTEDEDELKLGYHPWGIFFTILGTVLLDFDADACQSPARAYLLDVTILEDHARGLSTFTIMAGLGGFFGYATGGINWDITMIGELLGGHVRAVFTLITIVFIICVICTVTSFKEIPLPLLEIVGAAEDCSKDECTRIIKSTDVSYGALAEKEDKDSSGDEAEVKRSQ
ncbi:hypothetical protein PPYR_05943 [Photinus pyralis]|uniref:Major facilitator superfamily (MFS) profile domain-containing protein n=1 Tax=Photinus pyralis TaxID=7054 RepID=A0A5N4ASE6_PHOPY|nr:hypothetical protein PPYR_05943 [Photinus pyralis]